MDCLSLDLCQQLLFSYSHIFAERLKLVKQLKPKILQNKIYFCFFVPSPAPL